MPSTTFSKSHRPGDGEVHLLLPGGFRSSARLYPFFTLTLALLFSRVIAKTPSILPVDSIKPGMKGVGLSVFSGTKVDTFQVEVLDCIRKVSPRADLILCRLSGAGLERSGVIAGMSGSPVYIDDKLIGAVAYAWSFAKEPIAGVTPIGEMLALLGAQTRSSSKTPGIPGNLGKHLPIPLAISGFNPALERLISPALDSFGMKPIAASGTAGQSDTSSLIPGGVVGVALLDGDVRAAAVGTITLRADDKILAFGHPFFLAGDVRLPMTGGVIHSVLPSLATSIKIFSPGPPVGTITQDRYCGIAGVIGAPAPMIPVRVCVNSPATHDTYRFRVVEHEQLTPEFIPIGIADALLQTEPVLAEVTLKIRTQLQFADGKKTEINHTFTGINPVATLFEKSRSEFKRLFDNDLAPIKLTGIDIDVVIKEGRNSAELIAVTYDRVRVKPGETLPVRLELRDYRGTESAETIKIPIPRTTPTGTLNISISSPDEFFASEAGRSQMFLNPNSLAQLLTVFEETGREDELVVAGFLPNPGVAVGSRELPRPPPSLRRVFAARKGTGRTQSLPASLLFKHRVSVNRVVTGSVNFPLEVR